MEKSRPATWFCFGKLNFDISKLRKLVLLITPCLVLYTINSHKLVIEALVTKIKISFHDWIHYKSSNQEVQTKNSFTAGILMEKG